MKLHELSPAPGSKKARTVSDVDWVPAWEKHRDADTKDKAPVPVAESGLVLKADRNRYISDCPNGASTISLPLPIQK